MQSNTVCNTLIILQICIVWCQFGLHGLIHGLTIAIHSTMWIYFVNQRQWFITQVLQGILIRVIKAFDRFKHKNHRNEKVRQVHIQTTMYIHMCIHIYIYIHICIHIYIYIYIYIKKMYKNVDKTVNKIIHQPKFNHQCFENILTQIWCKLPAIHYQQI